MRGTRLLAAALLGLALGAGASEAPPARILEQPRLQGEGQLRWLGLPVYDARLWVAPGFEPERFHRHAFVLELQYRRALRGADIARRSIDEMARAAPLDAALAARWLRELQQVLPDVQPADRIAGLHRPGESVQFVVNGRPAGELRDPEFARLFFGIWLAPTTSQPALRDALLGAARR